MGIERVTVLASCATVIAIVGGGAYFLYQKKKKESLPIIWEEVGTLKKLHLYPLKSGHRLELNQAECTEVGLRLCKKVENIYQLRDRGLVVYGEKDHEFRTARTYPKMVLIQVTQHDDNHIAINAPSMPTLYVKIPPEENKETTISLHCGENIFTIDCGDEAASWFSKFIFAKNSGLRLGYHDVSRRRDLKNVHKILFSYYKNLTNNSGGLYSDFGSIMLMNQASVNELNVRLGNFNVNVESFRPNLLVDGPVTEPYDEDLWDWIKIGDVVFKNVMECTRCMMTTINPENGVCHPDMEPLKTLKQYRVGNGPSKSPVMGAYLEVRKTGILKVGDRVYVVRRQN